MNRCESYVVNGDLHSVNVNVNVMLFVKIPVNAIEIGMINDYLIYKRITRNTILLSIEQSFDQHFCLSKINIVLSA